VIFPIALSIFLITWGIGFTGTVWVSLGMLLSAIYLVCWDADRIWDATARLLGRGAAPPLLKDSHWIEKAGWALGGTVGVALFLITRSFSPSSWVNELFFLGLGAMGLVIAGWVVAYMRRAR
jgi:hypothetical protein